MSGGNNGVPPPGAVERVIYGLYGLWDGETKPVPKGNSVEFHTKAMQENLASVEANLDWALGDEASNYRKGKGSYWITCGKGWEESGVVGKAVGYVVYEGSRALSFGKAMKDYRDALVHMQLIKVAEASERATGTGANKIE